jgi:DNA-binding transcriptional LysR family regulator
MVKKGVGVGILFEDLVIPEIRKRIFKRIVIPQLKLIVQSYIVYHRDQPIPDSVREFLMLLKERATDK